MNIIEERDERNRARRRMKEQYDSLMTLSVDEKWYRLLQEGMVTYSDGSPQFYIMKGALSRFYEALDPSYEGSINIGHTDLSTFPERIVGKWTKADLRVVDLEDGRQALETTLPVNYDHPLVEAIRLSPFDVGLSVEMRIHVNEELTANENVNPFHVPMVEDVEIFDYAIVGNAGDVNSMGVSLKGELPKMDERLKKLASLLSEEGTTSLADVTKLLDENLAEAEKVEEVEEKVEETPSEAPDETVEASAEEAEEEVEEKAEEPSAEPEAVTEDSMTAVLSTFEKVIERLTAVETELKDVKEQLAKKDETLAEKEQELASLKAKDKAFSEQFKNLSVALTKEVKRKDVAPKSQYTDGIGE